MSDASEAQVFGGQWQQLPARAVGSPWVGVDSREALRPSYVDCLLASQPTARGPSID